MARFGWNWIVAGVALVLMLAFPSTAGLWIALALILEMVVSWKLFVASWRRSREDSAESNED